MDTTLSVSYETIAHFFEATEGNYRNAIYISCSCSYRRESGCGDFLYIPGYDCRPVLLPLADAECCSEGTACGMPSEVYRLRNQLTGEKGKWQGIIHTWRTGRGSGI